MYMHPNKTRSTRRIWVRYGFFKPNGNGYGYGYGYADDFKKRVWVQVWCHLPGTSPMPIPTPMLAKDKDYFPKKTAVGLYVNEAMAAVEPSPVLDKELK